MRYNKVTFGKEMNAGIKKGMDIAYEAVSNTIGSAGRNAIYRRYGSPFITNDGVTILREIYLKDKLECYGADLIKQAAERTNDEAGDGTTTSTILTHAMVEKGLEELRPRWWSNKGKTNAMRLRREIEQAAKEVVEEIKKRAVKVQSDDELFNVAKISVEDEKIARIVTDAVKKAGEDGTVLVEESNGLEIIKEEINGLQYDKGYITPYMVSNQDKMEAVMENVHVLITDKNLCMNKDLLLLLEDLVKKQVRQLFIIADDVSGELLSSIIANRMKGTFYVVAVKRPHTKEALEDIAVLVGAESLTDEKGVKEIGPDHFSKLGTARKVIVTKDKCTIVGPDTQEIKTKIQERIVGLKEELKDAEGYIKDKIKERIAKMVGGVVLLKVGAPTDAEMKYLKLKVDDAVNATKAAMTDGIIAGGGSVLYEISQTGAKTLGEKIVKYACSIPIKKIIENAGYSPKDVLKQMKPGSLFDSESGKVITNPIEKGIIDPAKVPCCAVKNAASLASIFLTSHCVISDDGSDKQEKEE